MGRVWYHTKFRPGTEDFLHIISKFYELHIVTFGKSITSSYPRIEDRFVGENFPKISFKIVCLYVIL